MHCEELILSVVVVLLLMFLIAFMCSCVSKKDDFADVHVLDEKQSNLKWGGTEIQLNNVMVTGNLGMERSRLPVTNSRSAIKRLIAETITPPWSSEETGKVDSFNPSSDSYITQHLKKKKSERKNFVSHGAYKNATGVRYMKMES
jgi:hypothetical protein